MTQNQKLDIIKSLNLAKIKVLEIYDRYNRSDTLRFFAVSSVTVPQNMVNELIVVGKDITSVITVDSLSIHTMDYRNRDSVLLTKMDQLEMQSVNFSKDFTYIYYISTEDKRQN
jgi:hypothetical protein